MDDARFDGTTRGLDARLTRRHAGGLATGALLALGLAMESDAKKKKKKKQKTYCLNGQTTEIKGTKKKLKKKGKSLLKQGATPGTCSQPPPPPTCTWTNQATFGGSGLGNPHGVAMTPDGLTVLVAIINNHHISVWTRPNASSTGWSNQTTFGTQGSGDDNFDAPHGVAVSSDGLTALVADTGNHRISVWTRTNPTTWDYQTEFGSEGSGPSNFDSPYDVALSADGQTALVADLLNHRISVWTRTSATSTDWSNEDTFGSQGSGGDNFNAPHDVVLAADGLTALIADVVNDRISVWTRPNATSPTWTNQTTFGTEGSGPSNFAFPRGVAVTPDGQTAVVSDAGNDRMSVWALTCTT